ncbi:MULTISPECIES: FecR family protein [Pseudomonas]|uniref:Iron dicitrate transport regulator FecR n=1 Tax=Pseudomonas putida S12 TaxID=1215087 RepID=A0AA34WQ50_PSEPU|nr:MULTISPECIES: FecR domain-containing protein [Pseudomonas]ADR58551.1 Anti-FecI sigma factor, FecR [Pseudomonas putida BIRD-1]AJA12733.1 iron dicitrate transport regulator FecR [Pseudomonas putida S12]AOX07633.1 iron dicitrate transport regulator FecR [Pseudomonas putida JB]MCI1024985.1 FecR domain-containing protein [Pseudomonas putida]MDN4514656.1 FecR domain-containing protein [Pseudomonas sp. 2,4-D]
MNPSRIEQEAAEWALCLGEGELDADEAREFDAWLQADPRHGATLRRMQGVISQVQALREQRGPVGAGLRAGAQVSASGSGARRTLLGLALAISLLGTLSLSGGAPRDWLADLHTAPAEWRSQTLEDGSQLTLAGNSAVDVEFSTGERRIRLLHGQVLVDVSHDPTRPFVIQTDEGSFKALGTRFVVSQGHARSELTMLESRVEARTAVSGDQLVVGPGERAWVARDGLGPLPAIEPARVDRAWQHHQLVADGVPLDQVLDALAEQRRGVLRFDRQAMQAIRVSAVLPLDDSERALRLLAEALPIRIGGVGRWWTTVEPVSREN